MELIRWLDVSIAFLYNYVINNFLLMIIIIFLYFLIL